MKAYMFMLCKEGNDTKKHSSTDIQEDNHPSNKF
jgi:hypothetical protein